MRKNRTYTKRLSFKKKLLYQWTVKIPRNETRREAPDIYFTLDSASSDHIANNLKVFFMNPNLREHFLSVSEKKWVRGSFQEDYCTNLKQMIRNSHNWTQRKYFELIFIKCLNCSYFRVYFMRECFAIAV